MEIAKRDVETARQQFEEGITEPSEKINAEVEVSLLKKQILDWILAEDYTEDEIIALEKKSNALNPAEIKEPLSNLYFNWGNDLGKLAGNKSGKEAESLYQQAYEKFEKAIAIKPDDHEAFNNWGIGLGRLAGNKSGEEAELLYQQAYEKFEKAIVIKPDYHEAFNNWGNDLGLLAANKSGEEAESLYQQAYAKYEKAIAIKPDYHKAFNNWGNDLGLLAANKSGEEADSLYQQAYEKYEKAIAIKPDDHEVFNNWGNDLGLLAATKSGEEVEFLYQQAIDKYKLGIDVGGGHYNLACLYAVKSEKENALFHLDKSLDDNEIEVGFVLDDEDWVNYLSDEDFKKLIKLYS